MHTAGTGKRGKGCSYNSLIDDRIYYGKVILKSVQGIKIISDYSVELLSIYTIYYRKSGHECSSKVCRKWKLYGFNAVVIEYNWEEMLYTHRGNKYEILCFLKSIYFSSAFNMTVMMDFVKKVRQGEFLFLDNFIKYVGHFLWFKW